MQVQPYLTFEGRAEEAIEFYKRAVGAEVTVLMRFKDAPPGDGPGGEDCGPPPGSENKIMHSSLRIGTAEIMASDGMCRGAAAASFQGFSLTLTADDIPAADRMFGALADGGQVQMPLAKTFFAKHFGVVQDRFGVSWIVIVPA
jgi:PhnB protein